MFLFPKDLLFVGVSGAMDGFDIFIYNKSITDIEYSPNNIAFGLPQTHEVR